MSSPEVNCSNLGTFIAMDDGNFGMGTLRLGGTCVSTGGHQVYSWRDALSLTVSGQSVSFKLVPALQGAPSCDYRGSVEGSSASRVSGTITCSGLSGTWEMTRTAPSPTSFDSVATIAIASEAACAVTATGQSVCWGANAFGELGTGDIEPRIVPAASNPGMAFRKLTMGRAGGGFTCGLTPEGSVHCWGVRMKLGDGVDESSYPQYSTTPVLVAGGRRYIDVAAGGDHACAVSTDGDAYCWGFNGGGQLGIGGAASSWVPALVAGGHKYKAISANVVSTCAVAVDGAAYCWGSNIAPGSGAAAGGAIPTRVSGEMLFDSISVGLWFVCGVTREADGYCWGDNGVGELGNGSIKTTGGPVTTPVKVTGGLKWKSITAAVALACGITLDGVGYCWGGNTFGERGDGTRGPPDVPEPKRIAGNLNFKMIEADWPVCGLTTEGVVYCWGPGLSGDLGDGTMMHQSVPTKVAGQR
jgi:alpha-tubulin suppressor-like RCC1 family protein